MELNAKTKERIEYLNKTLLKMEFSSQNRKYIGTTKKCLELNEYLLNQTIEFLSPKGCEKCH